MTDAINDESEPSPRRSEVWGRPARPLAAAAGVLIGVLAAAAAAQSDGVGRLSVKASRPVPPGSRIYVEALGPDERADALLDVVAKALQSKGHAIAHPGDLVLQVHVANAAAPPNEDRDEILSRRGEPRRRPNVEVEVRLRKKKDRPIPRQLLSVQFFLFAPGRPPIWSGTVTAPRGQGDAAEQLARMAAAAMAAFGRTEERAFDPAQDGILRPE